MNAFYTLPKSIQWFLAIVMAVLFAVLVALNCWATYHHPLFAFLFLLASPLFYFLTTPLFTLTGKYQYFSPLYFGYVKSNGNMEMHLGTNFDFVFILLPLLFSNKNIRLEIKKYFINGNLQLIEYLERNPTQLNSIYLIIISHLITDKNISFYNMKRDKMSLYEKIEYYLYCIDILWIYIFSCGFKNIFRIFFPKKTLCKTTDLVLKKKYFLASLQKLEFQNNTFTLSQFQYDY